MVVVLDDLYGLPVTGWCRCPGGQVVCRPHYPLESLPVMGRAAAIPGSDTARQDALDCASVEV